MLNLLSKPLYLVIAAAIISSVSSCGTWKITKNYYKNQYDAQVAEIRRVELEQTERLREEAKAKEVELNKTKTELELQNEKQRRENKTLLDKYNAAIASGKRLRDPGKSDTVHCPGNTSSASGTANASGGAELSAQASEFLLSEAGRADEIMRQLNLCKAWVQQTQKK